MGVNLLPLEMYWASDKQVSFFFNIFKGISYGEEVLLKRSHIL